MPNYAIGLTSGTMIPLQNASVGAIPDPYPVEHQEYAELVGEDNLGRPIEAGPKQVIWNFGRMKQSWYDWFYAFLQNKASNTVYIKTRIETGTVLSFKTFEATMWRPTSSVAPGPFRTNVVFKFTNLVQLD